MSTDLKLNRVSVIMLGVQSTQRSVTFYRDQLGVKIQHESPGFAFLDGGGVTLALSEPLLKYSTNPNGATEVVFQVEHVREAYDVLRHRGVTFTHEPRVVTGTHWAANFTDPDGHKLSVFGPE